MINWRYVSLSTVRREDTDTGEAHDVFYTDPQYAEYEAFVAAGGVTLPAIPPPVMATQDWVMSKTAEMIKQSAKRRVRKDITLGAGGVATIDITPGSGQPPYAVAPDVDPIVTMNPAKTVSYVPTVTAVSPTSLSVAAIRTKGTLLLTAGPIEAAGAGDVVSVWLVEK